MLVQKATVLPQLPSYLHLDRLTRPQMTALAAVGAASAGFLLYAVFRRRVDPEELEFERRTLLSQMGRIIDGSIIGIDDNNEETSVDGSVDVPTLEEQDSMPAPRLLVYRYRIAGVTYECAQDVSSLADEVRHIRMDLPVQVRYDPRNPGNSIVVSEDWNGLRHEMPHHESPEIEGRRSREHPQTMFD